MISGSIHDNAIIPHHIIGAVYSRVSSYVLGDWNACGEDEDDDGNDEHT